MGRYTMLIVALSCCLPGPLVMAAFQGPPMAAAQSLPGDRDRTQTAVITSTSEQYTVVMESAVDGVMTRDPIGYAAYDQGWQPNRFARLENVGDTDIVNPWLTVNGRRRWRSVDEMAAQAIGGYTTDRDKARAVWEFSRHHRFHACTWCNECNDAVKVFNVYGYTLCGNDAQILSDLWKAAGLTVRRGYPVGHCVAEVFYDGECHLLDGDEHCIYLRRDNRTIASEAEVVRDHDLIKRTHTYGILSADNPLRDQFSASLFGYEGERKGKWGGRSKHTMAYTLRPGESIEWRWDHIGKQYTAGTVPKKGEKRRDGHGDLQAWGSRAYANLRNGRLRYAPDFSSPIARQGIADSANLHPEGIVLRPRATGMPCHVTWRIANAYVVVGGTVAIRGSKAAEEDVFEISLSADGKQWERLWSAAATTGNINKDIRFDDRLSPGRKPQYAYFVRLTLQSNEDTGVSLSRVVFDTDVQMSALALPELEAGKNTINYEDESPGPRRVRVTHGWVERAAWRPPGVPAPTEPADAAIVLGTRVRLAWHPPTDPDGDSIMDYHVQVAEHDDMRWVLSPNFDKLVSKTPSKGKAEWTVPATGLLNPGTPYYWRVRARDACGVWGVWSEPQRFT
ncbi:MAG: hypothetical protein HON70_33360, partial [Lentisphaerae bacterium]|nr:hypothetical protein [Lentisphaerota bacterium]